MAGSPDWFSKAVLPASLRENENGEVGCTRCAVRHFAGTRPTPSKNYRALRNVLGLGGVDRSGHATSHVVTRAT